LFIFFFFAALLIVNQPFWEPLEWSVVHSWIIRASKKKIINKPRINPNPSPNEVLKINNNL
jgi:hypothetical protein